MRTESTLGAASMMASIERTVAIVRVENMVMRLKLR